MQQREAPAGCYSPAALPPRSEPSPRTNDAFETMTLTNEPSPFSVISLGSSSPPKFLSLILCVSALTVPHRPGGELLKRHSEPLLKRLLRVKLLYCPVSVPDKGPAGPRGDFKGLPGEMHSPEGEAAGTRRCRRRARSSSHRPSPRSGRSSPEGLSRGASGTPRTALQRFQRQTSSRRRPEAQEGIL